MCLYIYIHIYIHLHSCKAAALPTLLVGPVRKTPFLPPSNHILSHAAADWYP